MTDTADATITGWQNVLREIRRKLNLTRRLPDEPPLHAVEQAEHAAWQVAHVRGLVPSAWKKGLVKSMVPEVWNVSATP